MLKGVITLLLCIACVTALQAQQDTTRLNDRVDFLLHLTGTNQLEDAAYYGNNLLCDTVENTESFRDTISYICASAFDRVKNPHTAISYYDKVSANSVFYYPSAYTSALLEAELKHYKIARDKFHDILYDEKDVFTELKNFELAGTFLLLHDHTAFDSLQRIFHPQDSLIAAEFNYYSQYNVVMQTMKKKSGFVAGALSAVIPGLGKVYTGKPAEGLAAFLKTVPLALITIENYRVNGFNNPQLYIFGSLFALFYVGNIWGSTLSAQIVYQEKIDAIHHNILVGLRIPVDNFFR